jgi:hypothetical protein
MLTTTTAKKILKKAAKKVVMCQIIGKLKIPCSPNSIVKSPKKLILKDESKITKKGRINDIIIKALLVLLSNNFCSSRFKRRNIT